MPGGVMAGNWGRRAATQFHLGPFRASGDSALEKRRYFRATSISFAPLRRVDRVATRTSTVRSSLLPMMQGAYWWFKAAWKPVSRTSAAHL